MHFLGYSFNGNEKKISELLKIDLSVSKVVSMGFMGEGGFGDHDLNCSRELDQGRDHNR
jgi:hypothetical protein